MPVINNEKNNIATEQLYSILTLIFKKVLAEINCTCINNYTFFSLYTENALPIRHVQDIIPMDIKWATITEVNTY